ncbi:MAG: V-type proton ATPase V0 subunit D, ATP6D [Amphiamblys sp. WSBS2006]|nr:MAG: V-type proton ATPase V0 subunit D, ATP6D [Amphiamblys sp. WSBS2006]
MLGIENTYLEAIVRGYKLDLITDIEYQNFTHCNSEEEFLEQLEDTGYGNMVAENGAASLREHCLENMRREFCYLEHASSGTLKTFLGFITEHYFIENIILVIDALQDGKEISPVIPLCNPLGAVSTIRALTAATTLTDIYHIAIEDTPLAPCFRDILSMCSGGRQDPELIRNRLHNSHLESFYSFCQTLPAFARDGMEEILFFEADRRAVSITLNTIGADVSAEERRTLYPRIGNLKHLKRELSTCGCSEELFSLVENTENIEDAVAQFRTQSGEFHTLEDFFLQTEMRLCRKTFRRQFSMAIFYAYFRLKDQEIRNIVWIESCFVQKQKTRAEEYIRVF